MLVAMVSKRAGLSVIAGVLYSHVGQRPGLRRTRSGDYGYRQAAQKALELGNGLARTVTLSLSQVLDRVA